MHPYLEELYSRNKQNERETKNEESPYSPEAMGINENNEKPRSLNPLSPYADQLEEARKLDTASQEESQLAGEAEKLQATPEDASASMWAGLADIGAQTASNYAKASGVQVSGKPFNEATETVKQKLTLKENLRKNLLDKVQAKKAEREAQKKALYQQIGTGMEIAGEGRRVSEFETKQKEIARQEEPLTPQQQQMYRSLAAQRGVKIDLSAAKQRDVSDIEKAIGLGVKPESAGASAKGLDQPLTNDQVDLINAERQKRGAKPIPYGSTMRSVQAIEGSSDTARRYGIGLGQEAEKPFDPMQVVKGSAQERDFRSLTDEAKKVKEKAAANAGDLQRLSGLLQAAKSGDPVAANAAQRQVALMFNKGALSEQDVTAFSGSRQVFDRLNRWAQMNLTTGAPLTQEDLGSFESLIPQLAQGNAKEKSIREADIRRRAAFVHPGLGDYIFGGEQPSTPAQKSDTITQPKVGARAMHKGRPVEWDGKGWKVVK